MNTTLATRQIARDFMSPSDNIADAIKQDALNVPRDVSRRARRKFDFWLDAAKEDQASLGIALEAIKEITKGRGGQWHPFVRNALRLMLSLIAGNTDVLSELFPAIASQFSLASDKKIAGLQAVIAQQEKRIVQLESDNKAALLNEIKALVAQSSPIAPQDAPRDLRPVQVVEGAMLAPAPVFDDDDTELLTVVADTSGNNCAVNFIGSAMALQS